MAKVTDYLLSFKITTTSPQKATALRDGCAKWLGEDKDVTLTSAQMSQTTRRYRVKGVDTATKKPFEETPEAKDEDDATSIVVGTSKSKVVNYVIPT